MKPKNNTHDQKWFKENYKFKEFMNNNKGNTNLNKEFKF